MKKRLFAILLSALLVASMSACSYVSKDDTIITTDENSLDQNKQENNFDTSNAPEITIGYKYYLTQEVCKEMLTTATVLSKNIDETAIDQTNLRKILEMLIPTECTLSEFAQVFPDYTITNEFYSNTKELHTILVKRPLFEEIEFQFHCETDTHDSKTHQTEFQLELPIFPRIIFFSSEYIIKLKAAYRSAC